MHFSGFCCSYDLESILALQTTKFIFSIKFLIFRHPTHPWVCFSSRDITHELFSVISCHGAKCYTHCKLHFNNNSAVQNVHMHFYCLFSSFYGLCLEDTFFERFLSFAPRKKSSKECSKQDNTYSIF